MSISSVTIKLTDGTTLIVYGDGTTPTPNPGPTPTPSPNPNPTPNPTPAPAPDSYSGTDILYLGDRFSFGTAVVDGGHPVFVNGQFFDGAGRLYVVKANKLYLTNVGGSWYEWAGSAWNNLQADPTGGVIPPTFNNGGGGTNPAPTPTPTPTPTTGTFTPNGPLPKLFPASSAWNTRIDTAVVHPQSDAIIKAVVPAYAPAGRRFQNDFGPGMGIPYSVGHGFAPVPITAEYAGETDPGPYPIPLNAPIEAGSDKHLIVLDDSTNKLYEMCSAERAGNGFHCLSGAVWNTNNSYDQRPIGWTSADAAGMPILPLLAKASEMAAALAQPSVTDQHLGHALRYTLRDTGRAFVTPARHYASLTAYSLPSRPPMGMRIRINPSLDLSPYNKPTQVLLRTLQLYGAILADNGASFFVSGTDDAAWAPYMEDITSTTNGFKGFAGAVFDSNVQVINFSEADVVLS